MSLGFDPIAMVLALVAIYVAVREVRRNNTVMLSILECSHTGRMSVDENNGRHFDHLWFLIRNGGIPIHSPAVTLNFRGRDGFGRLNVQLHKKSDRTGGHDELSRGMIAEFGFKSYELDTTAAGMLMELQDPAAQDACLFYLLAELSGGTVPGRRPTRSTRCEVEFFGIPNQPAVLATSRRKFQRPDGNEDL
jgi:hypothetical protein